MNLPATRRRICYLTGTRADFGLMQSTLRCIQAHEALSLDIIVTGTHLSERYGHTIDDIRSAGLPVSCQVPVDLSETTGPAMALNIAAVLAGTVRALQQIKPDVVLLLGDRGEMLAGALAGIHLNILVAHVHGGERSGTVDEPVRHAISKLSHLHFTATEEARERLIHMGENPRYIHVTGAPGLDGLVQLASMPRADLCRSAGFNPSEPLALMIFHPVLQESAAASQESINIMESLLTRGLQVLALMPNSDAGSDAIRDSLHRYSTHSKVRLATHLSRSEFVSWMAACDVMIGNSSSGIIEAASFGTPVINVGTRQNLRERNANTRDVPADIESIRTALASALATGRLNPRNCYGDGHAGERISKYLAALHYEKEWLNKSNTY